VVVLVQGRDKSVHAIRLTNHAIPTTTNSNTSDTLAVYRGTRAAARSNDRLERTLTDPLEDSALHALPHPLPAPLKSYSNAHVV
jgi:hypothetical protein